jgi:hypothetical protein
MHKPTNPVDAGPQWDNPNWVCAIMCFPHEPALIARWLTEPVEGDLLVKFHAAQKRGSTAGTALSMLYGLDHESWDITDEPSLGKAVALVASMKTKPHPIDPSLPTGWEYLPSDRSEIFRRIDGNKMPRQRYKGYRPVWHLWAASLMMRDPFDSDALPRSELPELLGTARTIQIWAQGFRAKRSPDKPLIPRNAYLVPDSVPLWPIDPTKPFAWMHEEAKDRFTKLGRHLARKKRQH